MFVAIKTFLTSITALLAILVAMSLVSPAQTSPQNELSEIEEDDTTIALEEIPIDDSTDAEAQEEAPVTPAVDVPESTEVVVATTPPSLPSVSDPEILLAPSFYDTPALSFEDINTSTLPAVVNVFCASSQRSAISGATGSGIIIDRRGVILTNAHVAQYLLLNEHPKVEVSCTIRTGAPARNAYTVEILAFPKTWAVNHGADILTEQPTGTGEHDWALLYITGSTTGVPKPSSFPFLSLDTREKVITTNDTALIAGYPAGFLGGSTLQQNLWPSSSVIAIQKVFTFEKTLIDVLSLGGSVVAQGGSSGGAVVNAWNKLVGLIVTSSLGETTADRDLRAITMSHIDRSVQQHTGLPLDEFLAVGDFMNRTEVFKKNSTPYILESFSL